MKNKRGVISRCYLYLLMAWLSFFIILVNSGDSSASAKIVINNVDLIDVEDREVLHKQQIVIDDNGKIESVGPQSSSSISAETTIDAGGLIALPGFVNTHTHLWQHVAKGFYPKGNLQQWVRIYRYAHYHCCPVNFLYWTITM